ncbi:MAG TPA: CpsD/CapB family tyrosine-protein kinase [Terriglobales bacterium]|nr:CpsD/CapB family tyrosine-protein kinase [Terriglobales bacterium]
MSRIHEALRRAEQQEAVPAVESVEEPISLAGMPDSQVIAKAYGDDEATADMGPGLEGALQRCSRPAWHPNRETMLFFDGAEQPAERYQASEQFRTLRSRLYQARRKQPLQKVLIASALPGDGKTFVAANLAQVLVQQKGRRALLIDADLRRPSLHMCLGAPPSPGLSDYLCGEADEATVLQHGPMENLFFIPGGKEVDNPAELAGNGRLNTLLAGLAPCFDWIVVDSPAVVPFSDASLLANACDSVLIVVDAAGTPFDVAQKAVHELRGKPLLGVALNSVPSKDLASQYRYGKYYYGYKPGNREAKGS